MVVGNKDCLTHGGCALLALRKTGGTPEKRRAVVPRDDLVCSKIKIKNVAESLVYEGR